MQRLAIRCIFCLIGLIGFLGLTRLAEPQVVDAQSNDSYNLSWRTIGSSSTISGGGGNYALASTVGQPAVGKVSSTSYRLEAGFCPGVIGQPAKTTTIFLPIMMKRQGSAPDLIVDNLSATGTAVTVTIKNTGNIPITDAFWVDLYFNPSQVPSLNQPWDTIAQAGVTWGISLDASSPINLPILPGETRALTLDSAYFGEHGSSLPPYPVEVDVYALVDSVDFSSKHGAVLESNEGNNLFGPVTSVAGAEDTAQVIDTSGAARSNDLPSRK